MKNIVSVLFFSLVAMALCAAMPNTVAHSDKLNADTKVIDIQLDKENAVKIAETVLCHIYGNKVLYQKPWRVEESKESYIIKGQLPSNTLGGTAMVEISKKTGQVLNYSHGK